MNSFQSGSYQFLPVEPERCVDNAVQKKFNPNDLLGNVQDRSNVLRSRNWRLLFQLNFQDHLPLATR